MTFLSHPLGAILRRAKKFRKRTDAFQEIDNLLKRYYLPGCVVSLTKPCSLSFWERKEPFGLPFINMRKYRKAIREHHKQYYDYYTFIKKERKTRYIKGIRQRRRR